MDMNQCDFMEVGSFDAFEYELSKTVPKLPILMRQDSQEDEPPSKKPAALAAQQISFFKQEHMAMHDTEWLAPQQPPNVEFKLKLEEMEDQEQVALPRYQQTNEPVCPDQDQEEDEGQSVVFSPHSMMASSADAAANSGACPPSIAGFDNLPNLSADDVEDTLRCITDDEPVPLGADTEAEPPCVPEIHEPPSLVLLPRQTRTHTISLTLMDRDALTATPPNDCLLGVGDEAHDIMHELMDDVDGASTASISSCCDHLVLPEACGPSGFNNDPASHEFRQYDDAAKYMLEVHQVVTRDLPHTKKKPMLHEFLGYVLFRRDPELAALHGSVYFCRDNGDRLQSQEPSCLFRVARFDSVSEVWRRIKCNASKDCAKNMKRAMRMSTSNERRYFVNLSQRMHRMQVFKFGQRSMDFFRHAFPSCF